MSHTENDHIEDRRRGEGGKHALRILQYNVNKSRNKVLAPLLEDERIREYDVIAVQEPWRNPYDSTAYNPRSSSFNLSNQGQPGSRVSMYINKGLLTGGWTDTFHSRDVCTISMRIAGEGGITINIHNVYNPPPATHNDEGEIDAVRILAQALRMLGEHIVVGDFNLHHPR